MGIKTKSMVYGRWNPIVTFGSDFKSLGYGQWGGFLLLTAVIRPVSSEEKLTYEWEGQLLSNCGGQWWTFCGIIRIKILFYNIWLWWWFYSFCESVTSQSESLLEGLGIYSNVLNIVGEVNTYIKNCIERGYNLTKEITQNQGDSTIPYDLEWLQAEWMG